MGVTELVARIRGRQQLKHDVGVVVAIRVELCGTAIVFWGDVEERGIEKVDDLDDIQGDCNKEKYIQRVVLLEQAGLNTSTN